MASSLVDKYSAALRKSAPVSMQEESVANDPLARYKECAEKGNVLDVIFSFVAPNGDFYMVDNEGVTIVLKKEVLAKDLTYYNEKKRGIFLGSQLTVKITNIDEATLTVYVRSGRSRKDSTKNKLMSELDQGLRKAMDAEGVIDPSKCPQVAGRVIKVDGQRAMVDIMGKHIFGICYVHNWSTVYTRDLRTDCKAGDIYDFRVINYLKEHPGKARGFELSRAEFSVDPWTKLPSEYAVPDAVMVVRCVDRPQGKTYWWGKSELVPGIEIMGDYTKRFDNLKIVQSVAYKCKVTHVDAEKHVFKVVPFEIADTDAGTMNAIRFLSSKEKVK